MLLVRVCVSQLWYDSGMAANQFSIKRLLLATGWFALTAFWIVELLEFNLVNSEARARGLGACGNDVILAWWCIFLSIGAGAAELTGHRIMMVCIGFPPVAAAILMTVDKVHG